METLNPCETAHNILDKAKTAANYLLDLVLGAEEPMEYKGTTTPDVNITGTDIESGAV